MGRTHADLAEALDAIESLGHAMGQLQVSGSAPYNLTYSTALDLRSLIDVSRLVALSAQMREESRGAHFRLDFPQQRDDYGLFNTFLRRGAKGRPETYTVHVNFKYRSAEECQKHKKKQKKHEEDVLRAGGTV